LTFNTTEVFRRLLRQAATLPFFFFIFFAYWTILGHAAIVFGLPYSVLPLFFFIALGLSVPTYLSCAQVLLNDCSDLLPQPEPCGVDNRAWLFLAVLFFVLLFAIHSLSYIWLWLALVAALSVVYLKIEHATDHTGSFSDTDISPVLTFWCLLVCMVAIAAVALFAIRYDADDSFYLSVTVQALERPELPTLYYESLNRLTDTIMPIKRRVCTYELLVAAFTKISALDHLAVYYLVFPLISCVVFVLLFFNLYKRILSTNKAAIVAVVALIVLLICWGDGHRTYGNFSFIRFFQGKSLLIQIFVPAAIYLAVQYISQRRTIFLFLLTITLVGASGVSVNGILVAPLAVIFVVLGGVVILRKEAFNLSFPAGFFIALLYPLLVACVVKINPGGEVIKYFGARGFPERFSNSYEVLGTVIGNMSMTQSFNLKTAIVLSCMASLPLLLPRCSHKQLFWGFLAAVITLVFFPDYPFQQLLAEHASRNLMWRLTWIIPFAFLAACSLGAILNSEKRMQYLLIPLVLVAFMTAPGSWTVSRANKTSWAIQPHKYSPGIVEELKILRPLIPKDGLLIGPEWMTVVMASLLDFPPLPIVRKMYLGRYDDDTTRELKFLSYSVHTYLKGDAVQKFWKIVEKRDICSIILYRPDGFEPELKKLLVENGYELRRNYKGHTLWVNEEKASHPSANRAKP
jgi:hypothetical protein